MGKHFNLNMTVEEILDKMDKSNANTELMNAGQCFLQYKLHKSLVEDQQKQHKDILEKQNEYNKKQLSGTRNLVIATWILAIATIALAVASFISK